MSLLPSYKEIGDLIKKGATIEAQEKIMELREAAMELQDENLELKQRVKELEGQLNVRAQVAYDAPHYWRDVDGKRDGPFCQKCYDKDGQFIRVQERGNDTWHCRACNSTYWGKNYAPPQVKQRRSNWMA